MNSLMRSGRHLLRGGLIVIALSSVAGASRPADLEEAAASIGPSSGPSSLFAVVDMAGNLVSGSGVNAAVQLSTGQYEVTFNRDVSRCAYIATTANAYSQAIQAYTAGGHLSAEGVYVETKNQGGGLTDGPFHLVVACGPATQFAVVGYSADLVRASRNTRLTALGSGRYQVRFQKKVAESCAYLATVADPGNELVFNPSGVYTGSGPDARTVYIETKNPGGGLQDGVPFHLAVLCPSDRIRAAVVQANGFLNRGSSSTASFRGTTGTYALVTTKDISSCATVATRGSVDTGVPFNPATVEVIPGPAANTIGIEMRSLLFFGGTNFDDAFHAAIVCE